MIGCMCIHRSLSATQMGVLVCAVVLVSNASRHILLSFSQVIPGVSMLPFSMSQEYPSMTFHSVKLGFDLGSSRGPALQRQEVFCKIPSCQFRLWLITFISGGSEEFSIGY